MHALGLLFLAALLALWPGRSGAQCTGCLGDFNHDGEVTVEEILVSVNNSLYNCQPLGPRFVDNDDGTIIDTQTGLQWEKKSDDGSIHDQDKTYTWSSNDASNPDGTVFSTFLATLNQAPCFAEHCDWRLPSATELQSLINRARWAPAVDPLFNNACEPGCRVAGCSCTTLDYYWATPSLADIPNAAWAVDFNYGYVNGFEKPLPLYARAVRGGS